MHVLLIRCFKILYPMSSSSFNMYKIAVATAEGVQVSENQKLETDWEFAKGVEGYE